MKRREGFDTTTKQENTFNDDPTTVNKSLIEETIKEYRPEQKINDTTVFNMPQSSNPLSNVLMTDYDYNPNKKPAAPSYNKDINKEISLHFVTKTYKDRKNEKSKIKNPTF